MSNETSNPWTTAAGFIALVAVTGALSWYFLAKPATDAGAIKADTTEPPEIDIAKADEGSAEPAKEVVDVDTQAAAGGADTDAGDQAPDQAGDQAAEAGPDQDTNAADANVADTAAQADSEPADSDSESQASPEDGDAKATAGNDEDAAAPDSKKSAGPVKVVTAEDVDIKSQTSDGGVQYATGGVGEEATLFMVTRFNGYSLKLTNYRKQGKQAYLSAVAIKINDSDGKPVLATTTTGPFLFADLPAGDYTVQADFEDDSQSKKLTIGDSAPQQKVDLTWNVKGEDEPADQASTQPAPDTEAAADDEPAGDNKTKPRNPFSE